MTQRRNAGGRLRSELGSERGSAAVEAAIGVPAFVLFVGLVIFGGRTAATHEALESAAAEAARTASIARTPADATADAEQAATSSITNQHIGCHHVDVTVDISDFHKAPGQPGTVAVTLSCRLDLADLAVPGIPGSKVLSASMSSPLDTWRTRS